MNNLKRSILNRQLTSVLAAVFIKTFKRENLIPTFAKINLSVKDDNKKLARRIARIVMKSQIQSKHREKNIIILYSTLIHQVNIAIKSSFKSTRLRHNKKLIKFRKSQQKYIKSTTQTELVRNIVHNFSSYALSHEELTALSYGLNHHIPTKANRNAVSTECEHFFQNLLKDIPNIPESELSKIETKLRNSCEKYCNVKVPKHQRNVVNNRMKRNDIVIMKHDPLCERSSNYGQKQIYRESFDYTIDKTVSKTKIGPHKISRAKKSTQRVARKIKSKLTVQEYERLYPSASCPGKFYGTAKLHRTDSNGLVDDLPIRPIISNINTSTYI